MGTKRKAVKDIDRKLAAYRRMRFDRTQTMRRKPKTPNAVVSGLRPAMVGLNEARPRRST
jgi:hypothetical protein